MTRGDGAAPGGALPGAAPTVFVTGGAGFIGSALVRHLVRVGGYRVVTLDALTYAGHRASLAGLDDDSRHALEVVDVRDGPALAALFERYRPDGVFHLAAESHVDRSIAGPAAFVETNVVGTYTLLDAARAYRDTMPAGDAERFRFVHVSTDEVYGSLGLEGRFTEATPYAPNSPYSASKAASDHLVRAWHHTYGLDAVTTNCSNNYGPRQYPEKLLPVVILSASAGRSIPVYGTGGNVRDWLYVDDHADALRRAFEHGTAGETYAIGGDTERTNLDLVRAVCAVMDRLHPAGAPHERLVTFVADRPGHDLRYAIDASKARRDLGWTPATTLDDGLECTVRWYLDHPEWVAAVTERSAQLTASRA